MEEVEYTSVEQTTNAYTFKVDMTITLFAENEMQAAERIDAEGGFIVSRDVKLIDVKNIHKAKNEEE